MMKRHGSDFLATPAPWEANPSPASCYVPVMAGRSCMLGLWRYEVRRSGLVTLAAPSAVAMAAVLAALNCGSAVRGLVVDWLSGAVVPLVAGLAAAAIVGGEQAAELQATFPVPYPVTIRRRLLVLAVAVVIASAIGVPMAALAVPGHLPATGAGLAFAVLLAGAGSLAAARHPPGLASVLVVTAWLAVVTVAGPVLPWAVAAGCAAAGLVLLRLALRIAGEEIR